MFHALYIFSAILQFIFGYRYQNHLSAELYWADVNTITGNGPVIPGDVDLIC